MKHILFFIILAAAFSACSSRHPEEQAAKAAKQYYDLLLHGKYEAFVDARQDSQGASAEYRSQLIDNMRMFAAQMEKEHQGMRDVRIVNCIADEEGRAANAFLAVCFGDSTIEEVVVPMVEHDGQWRMR